MVLTPALTALPTLAACAGKPSPTGPVLPAPDSEMQESPVGRLAAQGRFHDIFGTLRRGFAGQIAGDRDGQRLRPGGDFVGEDGATAQRIWTPVPTGPERREGPAPGVTGVATGIEEGTRLERRCGIDLPVPAAYGTATRMRVTSDDRMWRLSEDRLLKRGHMRRSGPDIGEVAISIERPDQRRGSALRPKCRAGPTPAKKGGV